MKFSVKFPSVGLQLAGDLYVPDTYDGSRLSAVVVSHPWGGVKEQTAAIYAQRLARQGFAALAFDTAFQGESDGEPPGSGESLPARRGCQERRVLPGRAW